MNVGSRVRLVGVPEGLSNDPDLPTRATFERCLGQEFAIAGFNDIGMAELNVECATGIWGETIWVEPEFLELVND